MALAKLGIPADQAWYCGNSLKYDIESARSAGLVAIWYNRHGFDPEGVAPDVEVKSWEEFCQIVQAQTIAPTE